MNKTTLEGLEEALERLEQIDGKYSWAHLLFEVREALADQPTVLEDPHPPHRLCECTACLEYWTPLPDCDAFAASGKPMDHFANSGKMVAEPVCKRCNGTKIVSDGEIGNIGGADLDVPIECVKDCPDCAEPVEQEPVAWRYNSNGDWIYKDRKVWNDAEPLYAAPVQPVKQKPVAVVEITYGREPECYVTGNIDDFPEGVFKLYAAPVRTKDLTDKQIEKVWNKNGGYMGMPIDFARDVIAKDRELNK